MLTNVWQRSTRTAARIVSSDVAFGWLQRGLHTTLSARNLFERNVVRVFSSVNIPSKQDLDRLSERVEEIDRDLDHIIGRIERLTRRLERNNDALRPRL